MGVGVGVPLCGGFSSLENISCECGRGSVPDCCLLLAEMAQCSGGKSFKVFVRLRLHRDATGTDHPTLPQPPHAGGGSARLVQQLHVPPNLVQQKLISELDVLWLPKGLEKSSVPPGGLRTVLQAASGRVLDSPNLAGAREGAREEGGKTGVTEWRGSVYIPG